MTSAMYICIEKEKVFEKLHNPNHNNNKKYCYCCLGIVAARMIRTVIVSAGN